MPPNDNNLDLQDPQILVEEIPGPDFTTYKDNEIAFEEELLKDQHQDPRKRSYSGPFQIDAESAQEPVPARGLACRSYRNHVWSITLRCEEQNKRVPNSKYGREKSRDYIVRVGEAFKAYAREEPSRKGKPQEYLGYCPRGYTEYEESFKAIGPASAHRNKPKPEIFLNEIYPLCRKLYDVLFRDNETPTGLIAITGATDSSKSLVTRGLIFLLMEASAKRALAKGLRRPHLVTFEDPIEQYYLKGPTKNAEPRPVGQLERLLEALYMDYTPREKGPDAKRLKKVIEDALRQTPAVLFVGETRDKEDWKDLLEFAGSGHLVITTSHAGSVIEAMSRLFRDTNTTTASQRSEIARRVLGIINIRSLRPHPKPRVSENSEQNRQEAAVPSNVRALLPALWKNTQQSMNNLIADGLASVLPARGFEHEIGYYGRAVFANELIDQKIMTKEINDIKPIYTRNELLDEIRKAAKEWDIKGV